MAIYNQPFENKYEINLTSNFEQKENVTVTGVSTVTYKNGLLVDASGQTFTINDHTFTRKGDTVKRLYDNSFSIGVANIGAAGSNIAHSTVTATHARTRKTEVSALYVLTYGLFFNPSPLKAVNSKAAFPNFLAIVEAAILNKEKCERIEKTENSKDYSYSGLTVVW